MRPVCFVAPLVFAFTTAAYAGGSLTLLVQFEEAPSDRSMAVMKREVSALMPNYDINWTLVSEMQPGESFPDLVVVKFKGNCQTEAVAPFLLDERGPGPLGFTHTADGAVLPFSEVECDKIRVAIRPVTRSAGHRQAETMLGRALGRVVAHELYHVTGNTKKHQSDGVNKRGLTATQLTSELPPSM